METGTYFKDRVEVFTPTIRHDGLEIIQKCLLRQTLTDFRWVIVDRDYDLSWAKDNLSPDLDILYLPEKEQLPKRKYGIMNARNTPVPFFRAPLIVEIQDYHWFPKDTLQKFWTVYVMCPEDLISAYYVITDFTNYEKVMDSEVVTDADVNIIDRTIRKDVDGLQGLVQAKPQFLGYEMNISSIPLSVLRSIYPLDEEFDHGYQQDPHYIALKAIQRGSSVYINPLIKGYSFEHKEFEPRPAAHMQDAKINQARLRGIFGEFYPMKT